MAFDPQRLRDWRFEPLRHAYTERDAILYALGLGLPHDPMDARELELVLEDRLQVLPTFAVTLASHVMWIRTPELEVDWVRVLHAAQAATFHRPLPRAGEVIGHTRVASLHDRGAAKGSVCVVERELADAVTGDVYCTLRQTIFLRGNGGFGGEPAPRPVIPAPPPRPPDASDALSVSPRAALIYRLSGDVNPLHADPQVARRAGYQRPILHGLATYGMAGAAIIGRFCAGEAARLTGLSARFAGVVLPGETVDFSFWDEGGRVQFAGAVGQRTVVDQGVAVIG